MKTLATVEPGCVLVISPDNKLALIDAYAARHGLTRFQAPDKFVEVGLAVALTAELDQAKGRVQ